MHVWMHVHVRVRMHMHVRVHIHVRMDMHVRMGVHVRVHVHVCMHMRVAANVHVRALSRSLCLGQTDGHGNRKQRNSKSLQHDVSSRVAFAAKLDDGADRRYSQSRESWRRDRAIAYFAPWNVRRLSGTR